MVILQSVGDSLSIMWGKKQKIIYLTGVIRNETKKLNVEKNSYIDKSIKLYSFGLHISQNQT